MSGFDIDALIFGEKICPTCGLPKAANSEQFGRDATKEDGLTIHCRACRNQRDQERYRRDPTVRQRAAEGMRRRRAVRT